MTKRDESDRRGSQAKGRRRNQELNGDELWRQYTAKITPLNGTGRRPLTPPKKSDMDASDTSLRPQNTPHHAAPHHAHRAPDAPFEHGKAAGLDRQSQRRMRRGKVEIEARLDLHGMIQTQAHRQLLGFLEQAYVSGKRTVLVITGKGLTRDGEIGVLRRAVPRWLNESPMRNWIRGFDFAAPPDGGEGALYILLRRKR